MLANPIENLISNLGASLITDFFIAVILLSFLCAIIAKRAGKSASFVHYTPTLLTSLGILGTFCGIVAGLLGFDAQDIDGSIDGLLEGMKTAFTTSLVGMSSSIIYKVMLSAGVLERKGDEVIEEGQVGVEELLSAMKQQVSGIETLQQAIGGDGDSSLTSQIKLFRADTNDNFKLSEKSGATYHDELLAGLSSQQVEFDRFQDKLWVELQNFSDVLSKSATEAVIDALKQVISDFNQNLTEQFGENFQQLNEACKELVLWQDQYKVQLADMTTQYAYGVESIGITATAVDKISENTSVIPEHMEKLSEVTEVNQHQLAELERHLEAFKEVRDKAVEALPEIREKIDQTLEGVRSAATDMAAGIAESSDTMGNAIISGAQEFIDNTGKVNGSIQATADAMRVHNEEAMTHYTDLEEGMNANYRELSKHMQEEAGKITDQYVDAGKQITQNVSQNKDAFDSGLETMRDQLNASLEGMAARQTDEANKIFTGLSSRVEEAVSKTGAAVEGQIKMLEEAQERELKKVMSEMGSALATVTQRFTEDYSKLVAAMQDIVAKH
tara:strand:- start:1089 stop:2759 length:1671 start_codon:yes stop_codon:yes gene_type:complete